MKPTNEYLDGPFAKALYKSNLAFEVCRDGAFEFPVSKDGKPWTFFATPYWDGLDLIVTDARNDTTGDYWDNESQPIGDIKMDFFTGEPDADAAEYLKRVTEAAGKHGFTLLPASVR